jgi:hypothetical protein
MSHQKGAISTTSFTDVVFHSGNRYANASHGTKIWSLLIAANKPLFFTLTKEGGGEEQVRLAASIVHAVTTVGGRFLVRDKSSGLYYNVGVTCAQDSTHFALGGSEPHYAETLEEIARARQLHRAQCDYFEDPKDDALGKKVHTLVAKELDRLFHQAQHVEQSSTTNLASSLSSQHGNANKTWSGTLGEKNRKVAAAAEALTSGGNEQQEQDEAATNVKQVSALVESCHDDDVHHHHNNHNEEATQKEEPQHENSSDSSETVNQMREKHTLEEHAILEKEDHNEDSTTKRQRVDQE